jgi:hypothetical protein
MNNIFLYTLMALFCITMSSLNLNIHEVESVKFCDGHVSAWTGSEVPHAFLELKTNKGITYYWDNGLTYYLESTDEGKKVEVIFRTRVTKFSIWEKKEGEHTAYDERHCEDWKTASAGLTMEDVKDWTTNMESVIKSTKCLDPRKFCMPNEQILRGRSEVQCKQAQNCRTLSRLLEQKLIGSNKPASHALNKDSIVVQNWGKAFPVDWFDQEKALPIPFETDSLENLK